MKKTILLLCLGFVSCALSAQTHIPASKSFVGIWRLTDGMIHGSNRTTGMFTVNNPDGTFYLFTTSGTDSTFASILQYGTYKLTSDSTCTEQIVKHNSNPSMDGSNFLIKFRFIDENTMISQWKLGDFPYISEKWSRVQ
ncbi:MAG: DUF4488 domain-containing protein [Salinivirgaceae bacterium]